MKWEGHPQTVDENFISKLAMKYKICGRRDSGPMKRGSGP